MTAPAQRLTALLIALVGGLLLAYYAQCAARDWIAHDEGLLGMTARQAAQGQLPHRDFEDAYTGGLSYWHAGAFALFGENIRATRLALLAASALYLAAVYAVARHAFGPCSALLATVVAAVWSLPNYFAGLPSWYNAFFAVFGVLALLRFRATGAFSWLIAAGLCAGLSLLVKVVGLYFIAAAWLFLAFVEQQRPAAQRDKPAPAELEEDEPDQPGRFASDDEFAAEADDDAVGRSWGMLRFKRLAAAAFTLLLIALVSRQARPPEIIHFILPGAVLAWLLVALEIRDGGGSAWERLSWLAARVGVFSLAAVIPPALFAIPYLASGSFSTLIHGVFVAPQARIDDVSMALRTADTLGGAAPLACLLTYSLLRRPASQVLVAELAVIGVLALLATFWVAGLDEQGFYRAVWVLVRPAAPLLVVAASLWLWMRRADEPLADPADASGERLDEGRRADVYLLAAVAGLTSLVQFPYSHGIYFCYTTPLTVLAATFLVSASPRIARCVWATVGAALALFAVCWANTGYAQRMGVAYFARPAGVLLDLPTAQITMPAAQQEMYEQIAKFVAERAPAGEPIWAGPDCPEVPFLTGRTNIAGSHYDVLIGVEDEERAARVAAQLDQSRVKVAIVTIDPEFSESFTETTIEVFIKRFSRPTQAGRFLLFARE